HVHRLAPAPFPRAPLNCASMVAVRFLSREGRSNLVQYGLRRHFYTDVYHSWLQAPWRVALGAVTILYFGVNCLFAAAYLLVGGVENLGPRSYADAFFFSVQTIPTIGYGHLVVRSTVGIGSVRASPLCL